jgi:hypothetical protein
MKRLRSKMFLGISLSVLIILVIVIILTWKNKRQEDSFVSPRADITNNVQKTFSPIEGVKVPNGWYTHQTYGIDHEMTVLSRTQELPKTLNAEQISISDMATSLSPEDFIPRQGLVGGSLDSPNADWNWGIYKGHKTFSMTVGANETSRWFVYVFGGQRVQEFTLTPNTKTNPNLEKDREDFWNVITYYAQDASLEKLSRIETQNNCETVILPSDQEPVIQADPETGYVVVSFIKDAKRTYAFFNFNDDISRCTSGVSTLLSNTHAHMRKVQSSTK